MFTAVISTMLHTGEDLVVKLDFRWPSVFVVGVCLRVGGGGSFAICFCCVYLSEFEDLTYIETSLSFNLKTKIYKLFSFFYNHKRHYIKGLSK